MGQKFKGVAGDRVEGAKTGYKGTVLSVEGDLQDVYKIQWDGGPILDELDSDLLPEGGYAAATDALQELKETADVKPKKSRKTKKEVKVEGAADQENAPKSEEKAPVVDVTTAVPKDGQVSLTGRFRGEKQKAFLTLLGGSELLTRVNDRLYTALVDVSKTTLKEWKKLAKRADLVLDVVEVKEPAKRLSPKERVRQKEIAARRLQQLALARKNLAKKRTQPEKIMEGDRTDLVIAEENDAGEEAAA